MPEFRDLLKRLTAGESLESLLPLFRAAAKSHVPPTIEELQAAAAAKEFTSDDTFATVEAAKLAGTITRDQYEQIRAATQGHES